MPARTPVKKAVLVAVRSSPDKPLGEVKGTHEDTKKLRDLLINTYQYELKDIKFLLDSEGTSCYPTRENILAAMRGLVAGKQAGDHIVFSFFGHGVQDDPIDDKNERDGKDELLLPVDYESEVVDTNSGFIKYSNFIRDDIRVEETRHHKYAASAEASNSGTMEGRQEDHLVPTKEVQTFGNLKGGLFINAFVDVLQAAKLKGNIITHQKLLVDLRARLVKDAEGKAKLDKSLVPHPQMGSLHPDHILGQPFTL
ncbi:hypothetical protein V8D89_012308 [Ganoderma adspersum]